MYADKNEEKDEGEKGFSKRSDLRQPFLPDELRAIARNVFIGKGVKRC